MRASLLQIAVNEDESVDNRRQRVAALVREQAGADLVVLPELWTTGAFAYEDFGHFTPDPDCAGAAPADSRAAPAPEDKM